MQGSDSSDTETSTLTASENGDDQTAVIAGILSSSEKLETQVDSRPSGYGESKQTV